MNKETVEKLFELSREILPLKYKYKKLEGEPLLGEKIPFYQFKEGENDTELYQAHSDRSAILYQPFEEDGRWYLGYEFKGSGLKGGAIEEKGDKLWGGALMERAKREFNFNEKGFFSGALMQKPIAVFDTGKIFDMDSAIFVRALSSSIRLSDLEDKTFFNKYLAVMNETEAQYARRLGVSLGKSMKSMFDAHLSKDTMEIDNTTSEGEIIDLERLHVDESYEEEIKASSFCLRKFLFEVNTIIQDMQPFLEEFSKSFIGKVIEFEDIAEKYGSLKYGKALFEAYHGKKFTEEELKFVYENDVKNSVLEGVQGIKNLISELESKEELSEGEKKVLIASKDIVSSPYLGI